jgi:hypothetical protein
MSDELSWKANPIWWWDPPPPWIWKELGEEVQREIIRVSLETEINVLQARVNGLRQIGAVFGGKSGGGQART